MNRSPDDIFMLYFVVSISLLTLIALVFKDKF